jgi:hypothetical protein
MPVNNDQFLMSTYATDAKPINANECGAIQKLDLPAIPNSTPAKYLIVFNMNDGNTYKWNYQKIGDRNAEYNNIQAVITQTV